MTLLIHHLVQIVVPVAGFVVDSDMTLVELDKIVGTLVGLDRMFAGCLDTAADHTVAVDLDKIAAAAVDTHHDLEALMHSVAVIVELVYNVASVAILVDNAVAVDD